LKYKYILTIICVILFFAIPSLGLAKTYSSFGPFTVRNQNPLYLQTLNLTPMRATVLPLHTLEFRIDSAYSNVFEKGSNSTYSYMADMELWRLAFHAIYAPRDDMEVGIEIPVIQLWSGFLDPFIQKFHNFFGFPNAGRENFPNNQFHFFLNKNGQTIYSVNSQTLNLGDITLHFKHHVLDEGRINPALAWFFDFKFPTGQWSRGLGSGAPDFGLGVALEKSYKRLHGYLNAAYFVSARNDSLEDLMNQVFFSYSASVEFTILPSWSVLAQINGGTPLLAHTGLDEWDGVPLDLIIGFKGEQKGLLWGNDLIWQVGFSEDATSGGPSVDFTTFLSIGMRFDVKKHKRYKGDWLADRK